MYAMRTSDIKNHGHGDQDLPEIFDDLKNNQFLYIVSYNIYGWYVAFILLIGFTFLLIVRF